MHRRDELEKERTLINVLLPSSPCHFRSTFATFSPHTRFTFPSARGDERRMRPCKSRQSRHTQGDFFACARSRLLGGSALFEQLATMRLSLDRSCVHDATRLYFGRLASCRLPCQKNNTAARSRIRGVPSENNNSPIRRSSAVSQICRQRESTAPAH